MKEYMFQWYRIGKWYYYIIFKKDDNLYCWRVPKDLAYSGFDWVSTNLLSFISSPVEKNIKDEIQTKYGKIMLKRLLDRGIE